MGSNPTPSADLRFCGLTVSRRLPRRGWWRETLNTDATDFWGSGVVNGGAEASGYAWHGHDQSLALTLPPLGVVWLEPED